MTNNELILTRDVIYTEKPPFPHNMLVELTNICNHRCVFCEYRCMTRKKCNCDEELTKRIIKEAYDNGTREIGYYMVGEPFLAPNLSEFIRYAKELGFTYVYVTTNGTVATPEKLKDTISAGLDSIKFSVNAATDESYRKVHGKDDYAIVKQNITWLRRYLNETHKPVKTFISFIKCNYNKGDIKQLHEDFDELVDKIYIFDCGNRGRSLGYLVDEGVIDEIPHNSQAPCEMVFNRLHITADGYLSACCADHYGDLLVADLRNMSLKDAWYSDIMIDLRKQHLNGFTENNACNSCINNTTGKIKPLLSK